MIKGIRPSTSKERFNLFMETLLNMTSKVSKVAPNSVLSGTGGGVSKISGKAEKDIILALSQLFPDHAFGEDLDQTGLNLGAGERFEELGSSTYVRITADPGTQYLKNTHFCIANNGVIFELENDTAVGDFGFIYAKVRSTTQGIVTLTEPLAISKITPAPPGHLNVINEYLSIGGRDDESDEIYRARMKDGPNILASRTIVTLEQAFMKINNNVLNAYHQGIDINGKTTIAISTQNGAALSDTELDELLTRGSMYFNFTEYRPFGSTFVGMKLVNIGTQPIDMSFRAELEDSANPDDVRRDIQIGVSKYIDHRFFDPAVDKVEWDNLLQIVKNTRGIRYVPDQYFNPRTDITVDVNKVPRLRSFLMLDLNGNIISNLAGTLSPIYYPNNPDANFQAVVLGAL